MKKIRNILLTASFVFLFGLLSMRLLGGVAMRSSLAFCVGMAIAAFAVIVEEARSIDLKTDFE